MAEAKNELGKLFVDIGINGAGKVLKSLNSVAATFLLGKNAANQFVQTMAQPFKDMGNNAVGLNKAAKALGATTREYQRLYYYLKQFKSEDLMGDIQKVMEAIQDFNGTGGTVPQGWAWVQGNLKGGAQELFEDLTPDLQGALKFINRLKEGISDMDDNMKAWNLREAGLSSGFLHLWERGINPGNFITFSDEELDAQLKLQEAMERLGINAQNFFNEFLTKIAPPLIEVLNWLSNKIKDFSNNGGAEKTANAVKNITPGLVAGMAIGGVPGFVVGGAITAAKSLPDNLRQPLLESESSPFGYKNLNKLQGQTTGPAANITIIHNNDIKGNNAEEIAEAIIKQSEQDIEYSVYELNNLPGN